MKARNSYIDSPGTKVGDNPIAHYTRAPGTSVAAATKAYDQYLRDRTEAFNNALGGTHPLPCEQCDKALAELTDLSHAWADYFMHADLITGDNDVSRDTNQKSFGQDLRQLPERRLCLILH